MPYYFAPVARLQRYLGKELIADPNLAVIEFVKNAYDADATEVLIEFLVDDREKEDQAITISDNGIGLDEASFERNWMHPGYSDKAEVATKSRESSAKSSPYTPGKRVPVGEKGIGRLTAGRLGEIMHIYTRKSEEKPWLYVKIDWRQFETMDKLISDIPIPYELTHKIRGAGFSTGTRVVIERLTTDWTGKLGGRIRPGRSAFRLGRLVEDLSAIMQPIPQEQYEFKIYFHTDLEDLKSYCGWLSPRKIEFFEYEVKLNILEKESRIFIERTITRSEEIVDIVSKPRVTEESGYIQELYKERELENLPKELSCGPFSAVIYYSPLSSKRLKDLNITPGVFIYRDGIRVEPYGREGNDWLGAMAWKAARQGYAPVQPSNLHGYFLISRTANKELRDMTNRQGLVEGNAYRTFIALARSEFRAFGDLVLDEYVRPKWETREKKAQREAQRAQIFGISIIQAIAHSVRQSTAGLGAELDNIRQIMERYSISGEIKKEIIKVLERSWTHLGKIDKTIDRFLMFDKEDLTSLEQFEEVDVADIINEAVLETKPLANSKGVQVTVGQIKPYILIINRDILITALEAVVSNGIEAAASTDHESKDVNISVQANVDGWYEIYIEDNGTGIQSTKIDKLLSTQVLQKGRPGAGLLLTREALALAGGNISVKSTSHEGTIFMIRLPR